MSGPIIENGMIHHRRKVSDNPILDKIYAEKNWIEVHDNQIFVQLDAPEYTLPVIEARHPLVLIINGRRVEGPQAVNNNDIIEWKVEDEQLFHILVSEDRRNAFLIVRQTEISHHLLKNTEPSPYVNLELDPAAGDIIKRLELSDVTEELEKLSISQNLDIGSIYQELQEPTFKPILIAHERHPLQSETIPRKIKPLEGIVAITKYLDISTAYIVTGDVNSTTGNIVFSGDVMVYGDVTENMVIESLGNIYVVGWVYNAALTAAGSIIVKGNVIKSKLYAGYVGVMFNRIYEKSQTLAVQLEQLIGTSEGDYRGIPDLVSRLLFFMKSLPDQDKKARQCLMNKLEQLIALSHIPQQITEDRLLSLINDLKEISGKIGRLKESNVKIDIEQSHLSTLKSHGDILIRKEGVLQSDLYAASNIVFHQEDSVCRGSRLEAEGTISAAIVSGISGKMSQLKSQNKIMVRKMVSGRLSVANFCVDLSDVIENQIIGKEWIMKHLR
jgi:hypothetical protein